MDFNMNIRQLKMNKDLFTAKVFNPQEDSWGDIKDRILDLEKEAFNEKAWKEVTIKRGFVEPDGVAVILVEKETMKVIGFSYAVKGGLGHNLSSIQKEYTAYIEDTVIDKAYRGMGLVGLIMDKLEKELIQKGYKYLERDAKVENNYATNIQKHYQGKILESFAHNSRYGEEIFFRIQLVE